MKYMFANRVHVHMLDHTMFNSSDCLKSEDLNDIRSKCWEARIKWFDIGLELKLTKSELDVIQAKHKDNVDMCFTTMLDKWLKKNTPTLVDLIAALRQPTVGYQQLANYLEREGLGKSSNAAKENDSPVSENPMVTFQPENAQKQWETHLNDECNQLRRENKVLRSSLIILIMALILVHYLTRHSPSPRSTNKHMYYVIYAADKDIEVAMINAGIHQDHERENCTYTNCTYTSKGKWQLHVKVKGKHIAGSPLSVTTFKKLGQTITGLRAPIGVAVNQRGEIIVAESSGNCTSIFSPTGEKLASFGSDQFSRPRGLAVDDDGNILVVDEKRHRIQKFSPAYKLVTSVGKLGRDNLQFNMPLHVAISPTTKKVVVSDWKNYRVQILNPDLTFHSSFGSEGSGDGEFSKPYDIAFDTTGNMYVTDSNNDRVQVFNPEGKFLQKFGKRGKRNGELGYPTGIYIDGDDIVYLVEGPNARVSMFTLEGKFLASFGSEGDGPGQFHYPRGITVDKNGIIYVSESGLGNNRIQVFESVV